MTRPRSPWWAPALLLAAALGPANPAAALEETLSIVDVGAVADGQTLNTHAIQSAIDRLAAMGASPRGRRVVLVPKGVFVTGALWLKQGVELRLEEGAVLRGSHDLDDYPKGMTRIEGHSEPWRPALLNATGLTGVRVTGPGTLDGAGKPFWAAFWKRRAENPKCTNLEVERPRLVFLDGCRDVLVRGVTLKDSGFWNLHLYRCQDVVVDGVTITAPHGDPPKITDQQTPWDEISVGRAPSSDGIDVDSCQRVTIRGATISVGDDCIALKGSKGPLAMQDASSPPVEDITVQGCHFQSGHGVLTCGSEATIVRRVRVTDCRVGAGVPLVRLKLRPDTPQLYEDLVFEGIQLEGAQALFDVKPWTQFFDLQGHEPPTRAVRNVTLRDVAGTVQSLGELRGNPGDEIENITLSGVDLRADSTRFRVGEVKRLHIEDALVNGKPLEAP